MANRAIKRIQKEIQDLEESKVILQESGIYFHYEDSDIKKLYVMMIGPSETPYEDGFYFFQFQYPDNYPMTPPVAKYMTQGFMGNVTNGREKLVRFNPNLYENGKVCLSMLNTWKGPGWVPTNTIINVFVAIQALVLTKNPLENEPGFEIESARDEMEKLEFSEKYRIYNGMIEYANYKIAIMQMYENPPFHADIFKPIMRDHIRKNVEKWKNKIEERRGQVGINGRNYEMTFYGMKGILNYDEIYERMRELEQSFVE